MKETMIFDADDLTMYNGIFNNQNFKQISGTKYSY